MVLMLALLAIASVLLSLVLAVMTTPSTSSSTSDFHLRPMNGFWLRTLLHTAGAHVVATRFGEWIAFLHQSRVVARSLFRPLLRFVLLSVALGLVFALFFLAPFSPAFAVEITDPSKVTSWVPARSDFLVGNYDEINVRSQYVQLVQKVKCASNQTRCRDQAAVGWINIPKTVAKKGDIVGVVLQQYNPAVTGWSEGMASSPTGNRPFSEPPDSYQDIVPRNWSPIGKEGQSVFLSADESAAYYKCIGDNGCGIGYLATTQLVCFHGGRSDSECRQEFMLTVMVISGGASKSDQLASDELRKSSEFQAMNNSGTAQQKGLESAQFKNQSQSLISSLKTIANTSASSCDISSVVHGMPLEFDFCSQPRPTFLGPLVSIPVGVVSLLLSIYLIRTIFREIESFRPKGS